MMKALKEILAPAIKTYRDSKVVSDSCHFMSICDVIVSQGGVLFFISSHFIILCSMEHVISPK